MTDTLCTKCRNPECEYAGKKAWVMICAHEYVAPPQTHADRIRAMTDEELAEWIASVAQGGDGSCAPGCHACNGKTSCTEPWLEWLKQEAHDE